jgi:hypothetical protein
MRARRQAEQRFPVRVKIAVPPQGLGRQLEVMCGWLDETCGAEGWAMAPAGLAGIANDALALYFSDAAFAHAFVARFCCGYRVQTIDGAFAVLRDAPAAPRSAPRHRTP